MARRRKVSTQICSLFSSSRSASDKVAAQGHQGLEALGVIHATRNHRCRFSNPCPGPSQQIGFKKMHYRDGYVKYVAHRGGNAVFNCKKRAAFLLGSTLTCLGLNRIIFGEFKRRVTFGESDARRRPASKHPRLVKSATTPHKAKLCGGPVDGPLEAFGYDEPFFLCLTN